MLKPYSSTGPKSGTLGPALSRVADAVQEHVDDAGVRAVGQSLGQPKSTIHTWGADLNAWGAGPFLCLARQVPEIGAAVVALINGQQAPEARPTAAVPGAYATAKAAAELMREILADVEDGRFDRGEADRVVRFLDALAELLPKLRRDVLAAAR